MEIKPEELKIETYRKNNGGQVAGIPRGVRITHTPTGIIVESESEMSQIKNRDICLAELRRKLDESNG